MGGKVSKAQDSYIFGNYQLLETAGSGGMGLVYRATDLALGRTVALKVLRDDLRNQPQLVARFEREGKAFAALDHPNIVRVFSVGVIGRIPYIAMEFVDGLPLSEVLMERGALSWQETLDIGGQVADALACAHDHMIIHRDIKPGNILFDKEGRVHVTDFGIAKVLNASTQLTVDGSRLGTPQYMCPERCQNKEITASSDIYSLGVVLFQCMAGRLPYETTSSVELIQRIAFEAPVRLRKFVPDAPEPVERLLAHMLEKSPANRPKDARALRALIDRVRSGKSLDDHAEGMAGALAAFRESLPPGAPASSSSHDSTTELPAAGWGWNRVKVGWFNLSRVTRMGIAALLLLAVGLGMGISAYHAVSRIVTLTRGVDVRTLSTDVARWRPLGEMASFVKETPEIMLIQLALPDFQVQSMVWSGGDEDAVVALAGQKGSPRDGQQVLCVANPRVLDVAVILPPTSSPFRLLGNGVARNGEPGCVLASTLETVFTGLTPLVRAPAKLFSGPGEASAMIPGKAALGIASEYGIHEVNLETGETRTVVALERARIEALAYAPDGSALIYALDDGTEQTLWRTSQNGNETPLRIFKGKFTLGARPFSPDSRTLLITDSSATTAGVIRTLDPADGHAVADLGPGCQAAFHPSGACVLTLAEDHVKRLQLWSVKTQAPYERTQLTFMGSGLANQLAISEDGRYALSAQPNSPTLAAVQLPETM